MTSQTPFLSIIVPARTRTDPQLRRFLASVEKQDYPKNRMEVLVVTEGNSEQAKAIGIQRSCGDILGFFCADNEMRDTNFLTGMVWYASQPGFTGAYTAQYDHVRTDKPLSRYFALLGANDPLCWWLNRADRQSYLHKPFVGCVDFNSMLPLVRLPSIGDNGFFIKRSALAKVTINPDTHFPMDVCVDLRAAGESTYWITPFKLWHRSGENFFGYFRRRYVYTRELYFKQREKRRWHMVERGDWLRVLLFCAASVCVVPHLWVSLRGFRSSRDPAWFLHPVVSLGCTFLYAICFIRWGLKRRSSSPASTGATASTAAWQVSGNRPVRTLKPLS